MNQYNVNTPKLLFWFLVHLICFIVSCQKQNLKEEHYPTGQIKKSWSLVKSPEGKHHKHGTMKSWYPNGNLETQIEYVHGQKSGKAQTWYADGQIQFDGYYKEGYLISETRWDENGDSLFFKEYQIITREFQEKKATQVNNIQEKFTVLKRKDGSQIKHGTFRSWYPTGNLERITEYSEGTRHGISKEWFPNGKIKSQGHYIEGKKEGPWSYTYENGKIKFKILYWKDKKDGNFTYWHPNGEVQQKSEYTNNLLHGNQTTWYANGIKKSSQDFVKGKNHGQSQYWYPNGKLKTQQQYVNGALQDSSSTWFKNGNRHKKENYSQGVLNGPYTEWYPHGNMFIKTQYRSGKIDGMYQWWTSQGQLISKQKFKQGVLIYDSRVAHMKKILEASQVNLPVRFMGFQWGMSTQEVQANIYKLKGSLTQELPEELTFSLPIKLGDSNNKIVGKVKFNNWGELWSIKLDFPGNEQVTFRKFSQFIEQELQFKLGLPKYTRDFKDLPGMLEKEHTWGTFFIETSKPPLTKRQYPAIKAHLYKYENQQWNTLKLENILMREYSAEKEFKISGPFYDAIAS